MKEVNILYLDEINAAEADVLLRLDEALDDRRQIVLKESDGRIVKAKDSWFVIATINPLTHVGTKELPPQLLSRFPVRICKITRRWSFSKRICKNCFWKCLHTMGKR